MAWLLTICEGRPFDTMVRAAEMALALSEKIEAQVVFEKEDAYSPWRHLLSPAQQVRLRALSVAPRDSRRYVLQGLIDQADLLRQSDNTNLETFRAAMAELQVNYLQVISCRTGEGIAPNPVPHTWLVLLTSTSTAPAATLARYERVFSFGPCVADTAVFELPPAICAEQFSPPPVPAPRQSVLLIGHGDIATDCRLAAALGQSGVQITLFDPYHAAADYAGRLPAGVSYADPRPPHARHACYVQHSAVMVACDACAADNHFMWEAVHAGAVPLQAYVPRAAVWSPDVLQQAVHAHQTGQAPVALPQPVGWSAVVSQFEPSTQAPPPRQASLAPTYYLGAHQVVLYRDMDDALRNRTRHPMGSRGVAILLPVADASWQPAMSTHLQHYQQLYVDTSDNTEFLVQLLGQVYSAPTDTTDDLQALLQTLLRQSTPQHIEIIHLGSSQERLYTSKRQLDGMAQRYRSQSADAERTPQVLVHLAKPYESGNASRSRIGVSVATEAIASGLQADAEGRFKLAWLGRQGFNTERGRAYFYPFGPRVGFDQDEVDYAGLPASLANNQIDLLCCVDPFLASGISARTLWARKAVPLVGMLHSIHAANGATEAVFQLLNGPTLPCDAIISPSHCGAQAYQGLFDAAADWLGQFMPKPPRFAGRMEVIPYGIEGSYYQGMHPAACREALGLPPEGILLLSFGRFSRREKADLLPLLLAVRALRSEHPSIQLLLAGGRGKESYPDTLHTMVRELEINDSVRIYEDVDGRDKILMYGATDIFVTISDNIQETYGLTLLEAMAAGLPLVASGWNGYREIVRHEETGLLVPTSMAPMPPLTEHIQRVTEGLGGYGHRDLHESVVVDPFALTQALSVLAGNAELRQRMGQAGRRLLQSDYDLVKQARKTGDCMLELLAIARKTPWPNAPAVTPFFDPVGKRFAHYPSHGFVQDSVRVCISPWGEQEAWTRSVRKLLEINSRHESALMDSLLSTLAKAGPMTIAELATQLQSPQYTAEQIKPRVVRCLKYGFLQRAEP